MTDEYGTVLEVATTNLSTALAVDAAAGATVIVLADTDLFEDLVGQVYIDGSVYSYEAVDREADTITLLTGLTVAATADSTLVEIYPPAPKRTAMVEFGIEEGEAVRVTIPHFFSGLPDGVREAGDQETVLVEERNPGELYVRDVLTKGMIILESGADLDDFTATGNFICMRSSDATTGLHYPAPYAGILEVLSSQPLSVMVQRYTAYRTPTDTPYPSSWIRTFGSGSWSSWKPLNRANPVVANDAATGPVTIAGTTITAIPGLSETFTPPSLDAVYLVTGVFDISTTGVPANTAVGYCYVDSTQQTAQALFFASASSRATVTQTWIISGLSLASHTIQLRAGGSASTAVNYAVNNPHSTMKIILLSY